MNIRTLVKKSLFFYRRTHFGVVLGAAFSTAILVGALIVGDSIKFSLKQIVFSRLGRTEYALSSGDRFFCTRLTHDISRDLNVDTAPLLQTRGIAISNGGEYRSNKVQVLGVNEQFDKLGNVQNVYSDIGDNELLLNSHLASLLTVKVGDEILLRIEKLDAMPKDAPLAIDSDLFVTKRFTIKDIVTDEQFGRFGLRTNQVAPHNVFLSLSALNKLMELENSANTLLIAQNQGLSVDTLDKSLINNFKLQDAGLKLQVVNNDVELRSNRIFLDPPISLLAKNLGQSIKPILTYFVNEFRYENKSTPYSFITATGEPLVPKGMADDEIIINSWLANDLNIRVGESINVNYYIIGPGRTLVEKATSFTVRKIVSLTGLYADQSLMPDFPGLADEDNCRDWDAGFPIDYDKIRDKDEQYWDDFRGTPKAFVTLKKAQQLWENRFGNLTAIRFPNAAISNIDQFLSQKIDPQALGFVFQPVLKQGLEASAQSVDFAQLFIGLSFFIIVAALLLMSMLFVFGLEQRSQETGLFLALGYSTRLTRRIILVEGLVLAVIGSLLGIVLGIFYNQLVLAALKTLWKNIVGTSALQIYVNPATLGFGLFISIFMAFITMWMVTRKQAKQSIAFLQKGGNQTWSRNFLKKPVLSLIFGTLSIITVFVILATTSPGRGKEASASFFGAGSLLLVGAMAYTNAFLKRNPTSKSTPSIFNIAMRNNARRRIRSLALVGLLASGLFIVFTVGANRHGTLKGADRRESGTGGFTYFGESTIPVLYDLNSDKGRDFYSLSKDKMSGISVVPFKVKEGDDASCLNLNRITNPNLIGVDPNELDQRKAFTFLKTSNEVDPQNPWLILEKDFGEDVFPGIADQTVIIWGLGKSVGDTLHYVDENGQEFKIKLVGGLANSIFQGNVIISENAFVKKYPSNSGYRIFLVDSPAQQQEETAKTLTWALQDQGFDLIPTTQRLAEFGKVENTYLSIFLILGGLGLIIGSIGLGVVVMRNVLERRGELALLRAVGYSKETIEKLIFTEHIVLLLAGIAIGILAAIFAVLPALLTPGAGIPYLTIFITLFIVMTSGFIFTWFATRMAIRGDLLPALRNE